MLAGQIDAADVKQLLRRLDRDARKEIAQRSKPIGQDVADAIKRAPGVAPYGRVYAKLGSTAKVRTRAGKPPEVVIGGGKRFSGGATVTQLVRGYEFGSKTGDLARSPRDRDHKRGRARRPLRQFPPASNEGLWANKVCQDYEKGPLREAWYGVIDDWLSSEGA